MRNLLADDVLDHRIVDAVCGATTFDDTDPWIRLTESDIVEIHADFGREQWLADPSGRARYLSAGAALFNVRLAVRCSDLEPVVRASRAPTDPLTLVVSLQVVRGRPASPRERELFAAIGNRPRSALFYRRPLTDALRVRLERAAAAEHATMWLLTGREADLLRSVIAAEERELVGDSRASKTRGPRSVLGVLATDADGPAAWLQAGQAVQRILLTAASCRVDAAPRYAPIAVHDMLAEASWWNRPGKPQMLFEIGRGLLGLAPSRRARMDAPVPALS